MVLSSTDVCDLMIELVCKECSNKACRDDDFEEIWSHGRLMDCIREHVKVSPWLVFTDADLIGMFENLKEQGTLYGKIPEGFEIKDHLEELKAELKIQAMITWVNEELWDQIQYFMEEYPHE